MCAMPTLPWPVLRMLGPLSGPLGSLMERRIWTGLKHKLEDDASAHPD